MVAAVTTYHCKTLCAEDIISYRSASSVGKASSSSRWTDVSRRFYDAANFCQQSATGAGSIRAPHCSADKIPCVDDLLKVNTGLQAEPVEEIQKIFGCEVACGTLGVRTATESSD
jgi:hypothetical protein